MISLLFSPCPALFRCVCPVYTRPTSFQFYRNKFTLTGINSTAVVIKKEQRQRWLSTLEPSNRIQVPTTVITFEFTPEGATSPLQLEAEVQRVTASMQVGKTVKITYARANPRIVKLPGE